MGRVYRAIDSVLDALRGIFESDGLEQALVTTGEEEETRPDNSADGRCGIDSDGVIFRLRARQRSFNRRVRNKSRRKRVKKKDKPHRREPGG